jgi:LCP family protein required for cell wall assembly
LIVLLCAAGGAAVAVLEEVHTLAQDLGANGSLKVGSGYLAPAGWGDPQTLLLVGDDQRSLTKYYHVAVPHLANEMLLVRLDPSKPYISMMSIPRELWVLIRPPGRQPYVNRINSAYTFGIPTLLSTLKQDLGISVNHVVVITFGRFKRAVDEMGCVYSTVDRRYYHVNVPGGEQYQEINLQPGYQKLCGDQSLQFVSYRHGDTSIIRDARDQSFLLDVKKQFGPGLTSDIHKFEKIFGKAVQTDPALHSQTGILNLLGTLISSAGRRVRQVHFQATLGASYDTASPQQIAASVHAFLYGGAPIPKATTAAVAHSVHSRKAVARLPLVAVGGDQLSAARRAAASLAFPLEYPRVQDRGGSFEPPMLRSYLIHAPDGTAYPAYVVAFYAGQLGAYYDVQGTTWTDAPQFNSPDQRVAVGGRNYSLYYEGSNLKMVSWQEHGAVYWVRNSLTDSVGPGEMLAIAEQTKPFAVAAPAGSSAPLILKAARIPVGQVVAVAKKSNVLKTVGGLGGIVALISVPLLTFAVLRRRRELVLARRDLVAGTPAGMHLSTALAHIPYVPLPPQPKSLDYLEDRRIAQRVSYKRKVLATTVVVVLAVVGAGVWIAKQDLGSSAGRHGRPRSAVSDVPTVPVSVLNAGSISGAARQLADDLRVRGVSLGAVANDPEIRQPGITIMYAAGELPQAKRLAILMKGVSPQVAPIDSTTTSAAGYGAKLVVVIG